MHLTAEGWWGPRQNPALHTVGDRDSRAIEVDRVPEVWRLVVIPRRLQVEIPRLVVFEECDGLCCQARHSDSQTRFVDFAHFGCGPTRVAPRDL